MQKKSAVFFKLLLVAFLLAVSILFIGAVNVPSIPAPYSFDQFWEMSFVFENTTSFENYNNSEKMTPVYGRLDQLLIMNRAVAVSA